MPLQVLTGCFLPATFCLDLPDSIAGASVCRELLLCLSSILDPSVGAAALRADTLSKSISYPKNWGYLGRTLHVP